jgi:hypothetical protein
LLAGCAGAGESTATYVPAAGTDNSGAIFQSYRNRKAGYHLLYPGGWHVSTHAGIVRIAKLGNAIVIATRPAKSAPKVKAKAVLAVESQPRQVMLHGGPTLRMAFTKKRPATSTAPAATMRVAICCSIPIGS